MNRTIAFISILFFFFTGILESGQRSKLLVFVSIDRVKAEYTGGFKRLLAEGTQFTNADLNLAPSEMGPGHAALGRGTYPTHSRHSGERLVRQNNLQTGIVPAE